MRRVYVLACCLSFVLVASMALAQKKGKGEPEKGKEVFEQCGVCHNADSEEKKMGPGLKGLFKKATFADGKTKVSEETVRTKVNTGGNGMPAYQEVLTDEERDHLIAFLKTL